MGSIKRAAGSVVMLFTDKTIVVKSVRFPMVSGMIDILFLGKYNFFNCVLDNRSRGIAVMLPLDISSVSSVKSSEGEEAVQPYVN